MLKISPFLFLLSAFVCATCSTNKLAYYKMPKIDAHVHIRTENPEIVMKAKKEDFIFLSICTNKSDQAFVDKQIRISKKLQHQFPNQFFYITTVSMEEFRKPGWQDKTISKIKLDFDDGAIGLKLWKDIGMILRDSTGNFIMIDDPRFDAIIDYVAKRNKTLLLHCGEPKDCWLPVDSMMVTQSKDYYKEHPQYHMYLHPECPGYAEQITARNNVLAKHPNLRVVGAHLGSLEWSVDELAKCLDRYPNFAVDMSGRICFFQSQNRDKVRNFIIKYQERLLYGTDFGITEAENLKDKAEQMKNEWLQDWRYFSTQKVMKSYNIKESFIGLDLNDSVLRKIYYLNALRWYPEMQTKSL